jgi:integrase
MKRRLPSAREIDALVEPGRHAVGHGVYLQISNPWRTKSWVFRYTRDGKARHMGLGSAEYVTLAQAREKGYALRQQLILNGVDPLEAKARRAAARSAANIRQKTFKDVALQYIAAHEDGWRGHRSRRQWLQSLESHVFPQIGNLPIADIGIAEVLATLDPIAKTVPVTAGRIRSRIALVLDWATSRDLRSGENPARRPNLLPKRKPRVEHLAALPYGDMPVFMTDLRQRPEMAARALEFAILTAARPGEALGARWSEIDGDVWTIPANRMKGGREHRVPLNKRAFELLAGLRHDGEFCFPGRFADAPHGHDVPIKLLRRMRYNVTAHGFRATFKTWASERTNFPREIIEAALAHVVGDAAEQAYARGDMLARRRQLMEAWGKYCA